MARKVLTYQGDGDPASGAVQEIESTVGVTNVQRRAKGVFVVEADEAACRRLEALPGWRLSRVASADVDAPAFDLSGVKAKLAARRRTGGA